MQLITGKQSKPQRIVIYGPEGIGKSSLAAQLPKPVFADLEGGTSTMDVARMPMPSSWSMLKEQLNDLKRDSMGFKSLVVDTGDSAERLIQRHVCDSNSKESIEDFGYGKGLVKSAEEFARFLDLLTDFSIATGMNVCVLAHSHLKKFEQPDESGAYDRYEMKMDKRTAALLKEWADMVLFCNYEVLVVKDEATNSKKAQGGKRVIHTQHHVCWDAKNRHDLPAKLEFPKEGAFAQIAHCFPVTKAAEPEETFGVTKDGQLEEFSDEKNMEKVIEQKEPESEAVGSRGLVTDPTAFPTQLFDLMNKHGVQESEIQKVVADSGYYPIDTPIGNYEEKFVLGKIVAGWDTILGLITENRKGA